MAEPKFSVVLIARNEAKKLQHLIKSLSEFQRRGGEIILVDTGSTDATPLLARGLGCTVFEVRDTFRTTLDAKTAYAINQQFIVNYEKFLVKTGDSFFDFAAARNYAASLARHDMIAMPDCDEVYTAFDIDRMDQLIAAGITQFEYDFVFSHDEQGRPDVSFMHSKFYNREVLKWTGCVHEVLTTQGSRKNESERLNASIIKLEHFQNPEQSRGQYMTGLAYDCFMNPDKDRNSHYLARELHWSDRPYSGIKEFKRHITMNGWAPERAQSAVFIGDTYAGLGSEELAVLSYQEALNIDATRREPWMKLAAHFWRKKDHARVAQYASAALTIDNHGYYMDRAHYYRENPHMMLYVALFHLNRKAEATEHWWKALNYSPESTQILADAQFFMDLPHVTIVVPTLDRPEKLAKLQALIKEHANYPNYEVRVMQDNIDKPRGVVAMVNEGVEKSFGTLPGLPAVVMFLTDDCEPLANFLIQAVLVYLKNPDHLVALNDGLWNGKLATHWLANKKEREWLPTRDFFHPSFRHHGCDNYLTAHFQKRSRYSYAPLSKIYHNHVHDECSEKAYMHDADDKALLKSLLASGNLTDPV